MVQEIGKYHLPCWKRLLVTAPLSHRISSSSSKFLYILKVENCTVKSRGIRPWDRRDGVLETIHYPRGGWWNMDAVVAEDDSATFASSQHNVAPRCSINACGVGFLGAALMVLVLACSSLWGNFPLWGWRQNSPVLPRDAVGHSCGSWAGITLLPSTEGALAHLPEKNVL